MSKYPVNKNQSAEGKRIGVSFILQGCHLDKKTKESALQKLLQKQKQTHLPDEEPANKGMTF